MSCNGLNTPAGLLDISAGEIFLPLNAAGNAVIFDDGQQTTYDIDARYNTLVKAGVIPSPVSAGAATATATAAYVKKDNEMFAHMKAGYDFYNMRYKCAINMYMSSRNEANIRIIQVLNNRLLVLAYLYEKIITEKKTHTAELTKSSAANIADIQGKISQIEKQGALIKQLSKGGNGSNASNDDTYMRMIEYTKEKANVTNNLMQLYGFLNIVAIGVLFYVYRST